MKKVYFFMFITVLMISTMGCGNEEAVPETEVSDPVMEEETFWTDLELDESIEVRFIIEGMEEKISLSLFKSQQHPFGLYFDEEGYEWKEEDGKDILIPHLKPEDKDVWMAIWHEEKSVEEVVEEKRKILEEEYDETILEDINHPLQAVRLNALQQRDGEDMIEDWYIVEAQDGGVFLIQQKLFTEAVEGHGRRFELFLEHFYGAKAKNIALTLSEDARARMEEELQQAENAGKTYVLIPGSG